MEYLIQLFVEILASYTAWFVFYGLPHLVAGGVDAVYRGCPECHRLKALARTGAAGIAATRQGSATSDHENEQWACEFCRHTVWRRAGSDGGDHWFENWGQGSSGEDEGDDDGDDGDDGDGGDGGE